MNEHISEGTKDRLTVITMLWIAIGVAIYALITWLAGVIAPGWTEAHPDAIGIPATILGGVGGLFGAFGLAFLYYELFVQPYEDKTPDNPPDNRSTKEIRDECIRFSNPDRPLD